MKITATNSKTLVSLEYDVDFELSQITDAARDANAMKSIVITFRAKILAVLNDKEITDKVSTLNGRDWIKAATPFVRKTLTEQVSNIIPDLTRDQQVSVLVETYGMAEKAAQKIVDKNIAANVVTVSDDNVENLDDDAVLTSHEKEAA